MYMYGWCILCVRFVILHLLWHLATVGHATDMILSVCVCMSAYWASGKVLNPCVEELESEKRREKGGRRGRCLTLFGQAVCSREESEWLVRFRISCPAVVLAHAERKWLRPSHNTLLVLQPGTQECHSHFHMADRSLFWNRTYYSTHSKQHILTLPLSNSLSANWTDTSLHLLKSKLKILYLTHSNVMNGNQEPFVAFILGFRVWIALNSFYWPQGRLCHSHTFTPLSWLCVGFDCLFFLISWGVILLKRILGKCEWLWQTRFCGTRVSHRQKESKKIPWIETDFILHYITVI